MLQVYLKSPKALENSWVSPPLGLHRFLYPPSPVPAELSVYLTAPGKPGLAYLEDRGQVLSHFQCLSLHRVNHILHPGAGEAAGPAMGWERQRGQGPGVRKNPRCRRRASAPGRRHRRGRDATGRTGRGGGAAAPIARAGRTLLATQAVRGGPGLGVSPGRKEGRRGLGES